VTFDAELEKTSIFSDSRYVFFAGPIKQNSGVRNRDLDVYALAVRLSHIINSVSVIQMLREEICKYE